MTTEPAPPFWYTRPVVVVSDMERALAFYEQGLGFKRDWASENDGRLDVVQVSRDRCDFILCTHWPERVGKSLFFVELQAEFVPGVLAELAARGVVTEEGWWGYDVTIVKDPDGNTIFLPRESKAPGEAP